MKKRMKTKVSVNSRFLIITLLLTVIGIISVADASAPLAFRDFGDKYYFAKQQSFWFILGFFLLLISSKVNYLIWKRIAHIIFIISIILLILVLIPGFGAKILGAKRWLIFGPISVQPAEIAKFSLILYLARLSDKSKRPLTFFVPIFIFCFLIMLQPDFGTTIVIFGIGLFQIFASGINFLYLLCALFASGIAGFILVFTSGYRRGRLMSFIRQAEDPLGRSYHIRQIILALGSGGLFGVGIGQSRQKHLFLPETATDSIFAVISEELGFIGSLTLIILFVFFILEGIKIAQKAPDTFSRIFVVGFVAWVGTQTLINLGYMVSIIPLTGIPLPFISYGGSSLTMLLLSSGIVLNISRHK